MTLRAVVEPVDQVTGDVVRVDRLEQHARDALEPFCCERQVVDECQARR
jgi:hypothetical protein